MSNVKRQLKIRVKVRVWWCDGGWALWVITCHELFPCWVLMLILFNHWEFCLVVNYHEIHPCPQAPFPHSWLMASYWKVQVYLLEKLYVLHSVVRMQSGNCQEFEYQGLEDKPKLAYFSPRHIWPKMDIYRNQCERAVGGFPGYSTIFWDLHSC